MGTLKVDYHDAAGFARDLRETWGVYAAFAPSSEQKDIVYVKIGVSAKVYERLQAVRLGCPFPLEVTLWAAIGERGKTYWMERELHRTFEGRRLHGEWFRFDMRTDKRVFHDGVRSIFMQYNGKSPTWQKITEAQLKAYQTAVDYERAERAKLAKEKKWGKDWNSRT